jgi:hypothetical protein
VPTVDELRELAAEYDVSLSGVRNKSEIEDRLLGAGVDFESALESDDEESVVAASSDVDSDAEEPTPAPESFDESYDEIVSRAHLAGYGMAEARDIANDAGGPGVKDFSIPERVAAPDQAGYVPRMVRQMRYAEVEAGVRAFTFPSIVMEPRRVRVGYDLPEGHGLTGSQLQDLFVAIATAQENDEEPPNWEDFK